MHANCPLFVANHGKCVGTTLSKTIDKAYVALVEIEYVALVAWLDNNDMVINNKVSRNKKVKLAFAEFKRVWESTKKIYLSQSQSLVVSNCARKVGQAFSKQHACRPHQKCRLGYRTCRAALYAVAKLLQLTQHTRRCESFE